MLGFDRSWVIKVSRTRSVLPSHFFFLIYSTTISTMGAKTTMGSMEIVASEAHRAKPITPWPSNGTSSKIRPVPNYHDTI